MIEAEAQCCRAKGLLPIEEKHRCSRHSCHTEPVTVTVMKYQNTFHFCTLYCKQSPHDAAYQAVAKISSVFFCNNSGKIHHCTKKCMRGENVEVEHGVLMCGVTGIAYGQEEVSLYKTQRSFRNMRLYRDPYDKHRGGNKELSHVPQFESALRCQAIQIVRLLIFSNKRAYLERRKLLNSQTETRKRLISYTKICRGAQLPVVLTHLVCISMHSQRRMLWKRARHMHRDAIEKKCADVVVGVWTVLSTHTVLRDCDRFNKTLPTLVASILYLMKSGLPMNNVQIIPKIFFLETALPEANTLHRYGISRGQFTAIKNEIRDAIRQAIQSKRLNPRALVVHGE